MNWSDHIIILGGIGFLVYVVLKTANREPRKKEKSRVINGLAVTIIIIAGVVGYIYITLLTSPQIISP